MSPDRRTRAGDGALTPYGVLWLAYFATIGAYNPYAPLWLQSLGLGTLGIGAMASLQSWTRLLAPYGWSWLADHHGQRSRWLRLAAYGTALGAVGLALWPVAMAWLTPAGPVPAGGDGVRAEGTALAVLVVLVAVMFIANGGIVPLAEAALSQLLTTAAGMDSARYGRVRMWGSLGFILVVAAAGPLLQWWGIAAFPWLLAGLSLALVLAARRVPVAEPADAAAPAGSPGVAEAAGGVEPARSRVDGSAAPDAPDVPDASAASAAVAAPAAAAPPVGPVLRQPAVRWFFASVFFTVLAHTSVYAFLSLFVVAQGFDKSVVGGLWAVSVSLEIVAFWTQGRWFSRLSPHGWLQVAAVAGVLRFVATALGGAWLGVLMAAQALHVFTFAAHHSACIALVGRWFPGRLRGRGQALYSALGYGLSGLVGGVTGGWLIERAGLSAVFWAGAASAAIAWACARHFQRLTPAIQAVPVEPPAATR